VINHVTEYQVMWRWLAVVLIALGGVSLGYWGVVSSNHDGAVELPPWASPITGGMVLVSGLLLLLLDGRRE